MARYPGSLARPSIGRVAAALVAGILMATAALAGPALADIVVNVDQGASQPLPIAIPVFAGPGVAAQIQQVIANDLKSSGLFKPLDPATFPTVDPNVNVQPGFDGWKAISAQGLITGAVSADATATFGSTSGYGMSTPAISSWACSSPPRRRTGGGSPTRSPMRSMRSSLAWAATSIRGWCSSRSRDRPRTGSGAWRS